MTLVLESEPREMAADPDLPDLDELALELARLHHTCEELDRRHARLQDRLAAFPNEFHRAQEQLLAAELTAMRARRTQLEVQLLPLRRHTG